VRIEKSDDADTPGLDSGVWSGTGGVGSTVGETPNTFSITRSIKLGLGVGVGVGAATIDASRFDDVEESAVEFDSDAAVETPGELVLDSTVGTETISVSGISAVSEELHPASNINKKLAVKICLIIFKSQPESHNPNQDIRLTTDG
jgi:hypothetical protein